MNNVTTKMCNVEGCTAARQIFSTGRKTSKCREHNNEYSRKYHAVNRERNLEIQVNYRERHEGHTFETPDGYVKYVGFNHPAASPSGMTRYHRIVLWDKLNGNDAPCAECGGMVYWDIALNSGHPDALTVDHVNGIRNDNRPENLEPVHSRCNSLRAKRARKENVA